MVKKEQHRYITLSTPGTKKISVAERRVGSRDRMNVIAVCTAESSAEKIVDGLNLLQGEITKLSIPAEQVLEGVRTQLVSEQALTKKLRDDFRDKERALDEERRRSTDKSTEIGQLRVRLERAERERDEAVRRNETTKAPA